MTKKQAQRILRTQGSLIILHSLYQQWGLPTILLKKLFR